MPAITFPEDSVFLSEAREFLGALADTMPLVLWHWNLVSNKMSLVSSSANLQPADVKTWRDMFGKEGETNFLAASGGDAVDTLPPVIEGGFKYEAQQR